MRTNLHCSSLRLKVIHGSWNQPVTCDGVVVDGHDTIGTFSRQTGKLLLELGPTSINIVGELPNSQNRGCGEVVISGQVVGSFKCDNPGLSWDFFDGSGNKTLTVRVLGLGQKLDQLTGSKVSFLGKLKSLSRGNLEIRVSEICFQSPKFNISDEALLNAEEQTVFNERLSLHDQLQVLTAIVLVQTTFGVEFVS